MGDGKHTAVKGKGIISISTCSCKIFISDVLFVLEIDQNLLNVSQLIEKGNDIFKVNMKGKSFALNPLVNEQIAFLAKGNVTDLCHKRLGHNHYQGLLQMKSKEMVNGLPKLESHVS